MKKVSYNPANALSVLLAAVWLRSNQDAEVDTTDKDGTDFKSKIEESGRAIDSYAVNLLRDESDTEQAKQLESGILSRDINPTEFEDQLELYGVYLGNGREIENTLKRGKLILDYKASSHATGKEEVFEEPDEVAGQPIEDDTIIAGKRGSFVWKDKSKKEVVFKESEDGLWLISEFKAPAEISKDDKVNTDAIPDEPKSTLTPADTKPVAAKKTESKAKAK